MQRVMIVGDRFSAVTDYLSAHGYDYIVLKDVHRTKFPDKKFKRRVVCDFSSRESILQTVDTIGESIDAVIAIYENYVLPAAWIAKHLDLPGISPASAEACTDKSLMRALFAKAPEPISPAFLPVQNETELIAFAKQYGFPLILKPANLAKSLLVTKSSTLDELLNNYHQTMQQINAVYARYAPHRTPQLLVEEFLVGDIHSVDAFVDSKGEPHILDYIVDYQTGYDIGFEDNFHYSRLLPSKLSASNQTALRHCAALGVKALGMQSTPAHIEIIMTKYGPRIVEIGARNGGYRERMHGTANDIDIMGARLALALNQPLNIKGAKNDPCAVLELFPKAPGIFAGISHEAELKALPSLQSFNIKVKPDAYVGKAAQGYKMCAVVMLHHPDQAQFDKDLAFVNQHVAVMTQPQ